LIGTLAHYYLIVRKSLTSETTLLLFFRPPDTASPIQSHWGDALLWPEKPVAIRKQRVFPVH
jgi:hypothetical protein